MKQTCILILGMHRSSTSVLTGALSDLGVYFGSQSVGASSASETEAFYYNPSLRKVNEAALQLLDIESFSLPFAGVEVETSGFSAELERIISEEFWGGEIFAIKDLSLVYLYPYYVKALQNLGVEVRVVISYCHPLDFISPLNSSSNTRQQDDLLVWLHDFLCLEKFTKYYPRMFISAKELLAESGSIIRTLNDRFGLGLSIQLDQVAMPVGRSTNSAVDYRSFSIEQSVSKDLSALVSTIVDLLPSVNELSSYSVFDEWRDQFGQFRHDNLKALLREQLEAFKSQIAEQHSYAVNQQSQANFGPRNWHAELMAKEAEISELDNHLAALNAANTQHVEQQKELCDRLDKLTRTHNLASKNYTLELGLLRRQLVQREKAYQDFQSAIHQSLSWRVTRPLRTISTNAKRVKRLGQLLPSVFNQAGGLNSLIRKAIAIYRSEGLRGIKARLAARSVQYTVLQRDKGLLPQNVAARSSAVSKSAVSKIFDKIDLDKFSYSPFVFSVPDDFSQVDAGLKVAVVVHVFYLDVLESLLERVKNIKADYDLVVTVASDKRAESERLLGELGLDAHVIVVENEGYDILPFVKSIPYLLDGGYDLVCKLHTKKGLANLEKLFPNVGNVWLDILLNPIMGSQEAVRKVFYAFSKNPELGMLGAADMYKSSKHLMYGNELDATRICQLLNPSVDPANPWGFFAGSIFWCKPEVLKPLMLLLPMLEGVKESQSQTGVASSVWHALERVLGVLPRLTGLQTGLAYSHDQQGSAVSIISAANSPLENGSGHGVGMVLVWYINYMRDLEFLRGTSDFSKEYYLQAYPHVKDMGMDALQHYLRFGVLESCNPSADFSTDYYFNEHADVRARLLNPFVHYVSHGRKEQRSIFPAQENLNKVMQLVSATGLFNKEYYLESNPDVASARIDPLKHFCKYGWREHRQPCSALSFDMLWYADENIKSWLVSINPLLHYACAGKSKNISVRPRVSKVKLSSGVVLSGTKEPKRVCLFAGYDRDGVVDEYVVRFIEELSKHADVYYLADGVVSQSELDKLQYITKGAWAIRHGEYDFGSYSRLARYLVGWSTIRQYDEVLLVNDSSYLLSSLSPLFKKMDSTACDWWGLQATKGLSATRNSPSNTFQDKIAMDKVLGRMLVGFENDETYDFHLGSYFLAFRQLLLAEGGVLQKLLYSVTKEKNKKNIILRYEIGLTRRLLASGSRPATFIDYLYPFHPVFTKYHFDLVRDGFPIFKRFFLTENHYSVPQLWRWKEWLEEIIPGVDLKPAEKNIRRICDANRLYRNLHIPDTQDQAGEELLTHEEFIKEDVETSKDDYSWVFPVCAYDELLGANERMLFEAVKNRPEICKVVLYRSKAVELEGENVHFLPLQSLAGQRALIKSRYVFIKHAPSINMLHPVDAKLHRIINLWHGIPLKRIGYASLDQLSKLQNISVEHSRCYAVIASSKIDRLAMTAAFYPLSYHDVWTTGLPRNDVILRDEVDLPVDFQEQLVRLRQGLAGRRLVLFAPTFRNAQGIAYYPFTPEQRQALFDCLDRHGAVLGIREHMADRARSYSERLAGDNAPIISLDRSKFSDIELLYREADLLITDYSSCFIDFMLTGKPEICFAYDYESYSKTERGLFYELEDVFPGPVCFEFDEMLVALENILSGHVEQSDAVYRFKRKMFFDYIDDANAQRLVKYIENDIGGVSL